VSAPATSGREKHGQRSFLFAYGTLLCKDVLRTVIGTVPSGASARLNGFRRVCLRNRDYPAIHPSRGESVSGFLYESLPASAWERLDRFEGDEYRREDVVVLLENGSRRKARTYVIRPDCRNLLTATPWSPECFLRGGTSDFIRNDTGIRSKTRPFSAE
jgi:gamma-glutamylcyclotransferase (GGCT)/AIG2-like uncharacterized protein YtfP